MPWNELGTVQLFILINYSYSPVQLIVIGTLQSSYSLCWCTSNIWLFSASLLICCLWCKNLARRLISNLYNEQLWWLKDMNYFAPEGTRKKYACHLRTIYSNYEILKLWPLNTGGEPPCACAFTTPISHLKHYPLWISVYHSIQIRGCKPQGLFHARRTRIMQEDTAQQIGTIVKFKSIGLEVL